MLILLFSFFSLHSAITQAAVLPAPVLLAEVISDGKRLRSEQRGVVALTEEDLTRESGRTVGEVLREKAGIDFISGTSGNSNLLIRGASGTQVLVLIDGVKANDPSATNRYFDWSRIDVTQIERIEVLKGPQAVSYGSDAIGGVVVIRTKRGQSGLQVSAEGGSEAFLRSRVSYGMSLDSVHELRFYALGKGVFAGGSSALPTSAATPVSSLEGDNSREASVGAELDSRFSDSIRSKLQADLRVAEEDIDQGAFDDDPNDVARNREIRGALNLEASQWKTLLSHLDFRRAYLDSPDANHTFSSDYIFRGQNTRGEIQLHSPPTRYGQTKGMEWVMGVELTRESLGIESRISPVSLARTHAETSALFAETSVPIDLRGLLRLDFGSRFSHFTTFGDQWSGKMGATMAVNPTLLIDAGVSTGFKAPSLYSLYDPTYGNEQLKPEESVQAELGATFSPTRMSTFEVRGFQSWVRNRFGFAPSPSFRSLNIAKADIRGVELGLDHRLSLGFRFASSTTYLSTHDQKTGEPLTDTPQWKQTFKGIFTPTPLSSLTLSFLLKSSRGASIGVSRIPGFGRLDLAATQELAQNFSLNARVENLLNQEYQEVLGFRSRGLSAYVGAEYRGF